MPRNSQKSKVFTWLILNHLSIDKNLISKIISRRSHLRALVSGMNPQVSRLLIQIQKLNFLLLFFMYFWITKVLTLNAYFALFARTFFRGRRIRNSCLSVRAFAAHSKCKTIASRNTNHRTFVCFTAAHFFTSVLCSGRLSYCWF